MTTLRFLEHQPHLSNEPGIDITVHIWLGKGLYSHKELSGNGVCVLDDYVPSERGPFIVLPCNKIITI